MSRRWLVVILGIVILACLGTALVYQVDAQDRREALGSGSKIAQTSSGPIEYRILGSDGPMIALLHGGPGGYDTEWPMPGYRVLVPSRPGYLRTPLSTGTTPVQQADALAALLDTLAVERIAVIGLSAGGPAAIEFAARHRSRTLALVALEAVSETFSLPAEIPFFLRSDFAGWLFITAMENLLSTDTLLSTVIPAAANRNLVLADSTKIAAAKTMMWQWWPAATGRLDGLLNDLEQLRTLELPYADVKVPTLIIHGDADAAVPVTTSRKLAERIAGAQLQIIPQADHFMVVSHEELIKSLIDDFLASSAQEARQ